MNPTPLIVASFVFGVASFATAQPEDHPRRELPQELLEQFDIDLDGKLSKDERSLMREESKLRAETYKLKMLTRFDANADGQLDREERQLARETVQSEMLEKYDANDDGELSRDERKAAAKAEDLPPRHMMRPEGRRGQRGERGERGARGTQGEHGERLGHFGDEMTPAGPPSESCLNGECPKGEKGARGQRGPRGKRGERGTRGARRGKAGHRFRMDPEQMQRFDTDGDGQISPEEKAAARKQFTERKRADRTQRRVSNTIDANNDGLIDPDELAGALEMIRLGDQSMDLNRDGTVDDKDTLLLIEKAIAPKPESIHNP